MCTTVQTNVGHRFVLLYCVIVHSWKVENYLLTVNYTLAFETCSKVLFCKIKMMPFWKHKIQRVIFNTWYLWYVIAFMQAVVCRALFIFWLRIVVSMQQFIRYRICTLLIYVNYLFLGHRRTKWAMQFKAVFSLTRKTCYWKSVFLTFRKDLVLPTILVSTFTIIHFLRLVYYSGSIS